MANIKLNNNIYPIPDSKLSAAMSTFIAHLGTIAGNDLKIVVNGVEYGIDATKIGGAMAELGTAFGELENGGEERLEGDGAEYYSLAPTALSFRSTEPLNEFQEVQVNGQTVDPSNYTLEEGSTIVKLSIDYLKTLGAGNHEVSIVSQNKTVNGGFTITKPELNEYGFYYNQPYTAYVDYFGANATLFVREGGILDAIIDGVIAPCSYTMENNNIIIDAGELGELRGIISSNGSEIYITELAATCVLGDDSIVADEDYIYIYKEDLGGYEVKCIDKTKAVYGAIKTGINGIDTVKLTDNMFALQDENGWYLVNSTLIKAPIIPNTVTSLGIRTFCNCLSLESVALPNSVTSISDYAFGGCSSLTNIEIPDSVTSIGGNAFNDCSLLTNVTIGNSVTSIGGNAFRNCDSLTSIVIPNSVISIGGDAFNRCSSLTSVEIGDSVTSIDYGAFCYCRSLTNIKIPNSVTSIGNDTFRGCSSLTNITIPDSVTSIGRTAFNGCTSLTNVTIGNSVTSIGNNAFEYCTSLTNIEIPNSVINIGNNVFHNCPSLISIEVDENNAYYKSIDGNLYDKNAKILIQYAIGKKDTTFVIPNSVTGVGNYAFDDCSSLININIPDSVTSIGDGAFGNCSSLTSIEIPDSVTSIGDYAFSGCSSLTSITLPFVGGSATATNASPTTLFGCIFGINSYTGGTSTKQYYGGSRYSTYYIPTSLKSVTITGGNILYGAFYGCSNLTSIVIPDSVTSIGYNAFYRCKALTYINIPDSVTNISSGAFYDCESLTSITFDGTMAQWNAITKGDRWHYDIPATYVQCSDGQVAL